MHLKANGLILSERRSLLGNALSLGVGADLLASLSNHYIDISSVVKHALLGAASWLLALLVLLGHLWCLSLNFTCSRKRAVHLTTTSESEHQVERRFLLNVVVAQSATILQLLTSEDQSLLIRWDALLVLDLALDSLNSIAGLYIKGDGLAREGLNEDLHPAHHSM
jgi:hypothetical protein